MFNDPTFLTNLVEGIGAVVLAILTYYASRHMNSATVQKKVGTAKDVVNEVVSYVEQMSQNNTMSSADKKSVAMQTAKSVLNDFGVSLSDNTISTLIESAVNIMSDFKGHPKADVQATQEESKITGIIAQTAQQTAQAVVGASNSTAANGGK